VRIARTTTAAAALREAAALAGRSRDLVAVWGRRRLDPRLREEVMVAVAEANSCRWCAMAHRRWALAEGVTDAELAAIEGQDADRFDRRSWAAIAWAQARSRTDLGPVPVELETELATHYDEGERADLELVTQAMGVANRSANTFDALLGRLRGRPVAGSNLGDELAIGGVVALTIPPVATYLALRRALGRARLRLPRAGGSADSPSRHRKTGTGRRPPAPDTRRRRMGLRPS
jgi:AhpD family alkylhydroperoxidase